MSGGWKGSDRRRRLPPGWAKIRARILERDPVCVLCGVRPSRFCDHIIAKADLNGESDLQGVCGPCHDQKSSAEGNAARRENPPPSRKRPPEQHPGLL
ncbi:HNH endonuclease signature motif containing protein [Streptomyces sp. NRRL F-5630]|uniref:HNH endonuclease signature motif containing protein n=1 Tax=Streptomyces sp. NRRL F-5630 TaxID=1463864 RepID=UPI003EBDB743